MATGAIALTLYRYMFLTFSNQDLLESKDVESLFDVVNEGRWTLDYQIELASRLYDDTNGNGITDDGDTFGFLSYMGVYIDPYLSSCQNTILTKDADNWLVYSLDVDRLSDTLEKVITLFHNCNAYITVPGNGMFRK